MSIIKVPQSYFGYFENLTVVARPERTFSSSSSGVTGSIRVLPQVSDSMIDLTYRTSEGEGLNNAVVKVFEDNRDLIQQASLEGGDAGIMSAIFDKQILEQIPSDPRSSRKVSIIRFEPSFGFTSDTLRKNVIKDVLYPFHAVAYPSAYWGYTNYLSLNFISGSDFGPRALAYASPATTTGSYLFPDGEFTIEGYIKPSYRGNGEYHAGCIMHMSSSFSLFIVSGSDVDYLGRPNSFRLMLHLSQSANFDPGSVSLSVPNNQRTFPNDLIFLSGDEIKFNGWHHFAVRWGSKVNFGTGSFVIDGIKSAEFVVPSSSIQQVTPSSPTLTPDALFIGSRYEGPNETGNALRGLFNDATAAIEGFTQPYGPESEDEPTNYSLKNPLGAELHELRIWSEYKDIELIQSGANRTPSDTSSLKFHLPVVFRDYSPTRSLLYTPFQTFTGNTSTPVVPELEFAVGGRMVNVENHVRDEVSLAFPRLLNLTASLAQVTTEQLEANQILFGIKQNAARNLFILPCDNGKFVPNYVALQKYSTGSRFEGPGPASLSTVSMRNLISSSIGTLEGLEMNDSLLSVICGPGPEDLSIAKPDVSSLTIYQRTKDADSNLVTMFDASNLFYGNRIHPGTFTINDSSLSGSSGLLSVTLKDNGLGGLYRADASTEHARWANVGSILYEEGIATVVDPYFGELFGRNQFEVNFRGEHTIPVLENSFVIPAWQVFSSSMPSYMELTASDYANEQYTGFVNITRMNMHDSNLNVIARAELSQPIQKRINDKLLMRVKFDF